VLVIAESGIANHADVERLAPIADAFLVGSSLMASADVAGAARALVHGPVKLCGLTRIQDVELAALAGATHAGFIFVSGTPRAVTAATASELAAVARAAGLRTVGVFRDLPPTQVAATAAAVGLDIVQLHGDEDVGAMRACLPANIELWEATADGAPARGGADRILFDRGAGGTGESFDWRTIAGRDDLAGAFLAGGIGPQNARAASQVGAYGLDVGSAVEARPGEKDPIKVKALFAALRPACRGDMA
jgi:indole-3-glycerol phosphate synthase/phosphoribosylanthranilate isomerase